MTAMTGDPARFLSVLRHCRVDTIRPGQDSTFEVSGFVETGLLQESDRLGAAYSAAAMDDHLFSWIQLLHSLGEIVQRDEISVEVADLVLVGLAHIQNEHILFG